MTTNPFTPSSHTLSLTTSKHHHTASSTLNLQGGKHEPNNTMAKERTFETKSKASKGYFKIMGWK